MEPTRISPPSLGEPPYHGIYLVDKPAGWTSFDVIAQMRRLLGERKIGHAGTLDPMATGLLIVCVGRVYTKQIATFTDWNKEYTGTLRLGEQTPSFDSETEVAIRAPWQHLSEDQIRGAADSYLGDIRQVTPMFSAVKVGGERLYEKARRGEKIRTPVRDVRIESLDVTGIHGSDVSFRVTCSKGTYIRSLAHDIGEKLGVGAHLVALRRTKTGPWSVDDAWTLESLGKASPRNPESRSSPRVDP